MNDDTKNRDPLNTLKHDTVDTVNEARHRTAAVAEKAKREVAGDTMSAGDRLKSHVNEAVNAGQAEVSAAKRDVRHAPDADADV